MRLIAILLCSLFSTTAFSAPTATDYGLKVAGVDVTSDNCADLSVIDGVKGTVSYDPATKTLTLQDATIDKADAVNVKNVSVDGLKVNIVGTNNLTSDYGANIAIEKETTFQGTGTLKMKSNYYGISVKRNDINYTIRDCKMYIEGVTGLDGFFSNTTLTIINAYIEIISTKAAITRCDNLYLQRCAITEPTGAVFDASQRSIVVDGARVTGKLVIAPEKPVFKVAGGYRQRGRDGTPDKTGGQQHHHLGIGCRHGDRQTDPHRRRRQAQGDQHGHERHTDAGRAPQHRGL